MLSVELNNKQATMKQSKTEKAVFAKLSTQKVELEEHKIELSALDDLNAKYKKIAANAPKIKNVVQKEANNLAAVATSLGTIKGQFEKIEQSAKELGMEIPSAYRSMAEVAESLAKEWGKAATKIATAAKEI